jgi:hypothetical protein
VPAGTQLLFAETGADDLFVEEEQMMPFLPIVRVKSVEEGIALAKKAEQGYKHSAMIHSHDVGHMTAMAGRWRPRCSSRTAPVWPGWAAAARATQLLDRHHHRRGHLQPAHLHPRATVRDG